MIKISVKTCFINSVKKKKKKIKFKDFIKLWSEH